MILQYKVGESVTIKEILPWKHKHFSIDRQMEQYAGCIAIIEDFRFELVNPSELIGYVLDVDGGKFGWEDTMFESEGEDER